jgi:hypothetical protein
MGSINGRPGHLIPVYMLVPLVYGIAKNLGKLSDTVG